MSFLHCHFAFNGFNIFFSLLWLISLHSVLLYGYTLTFVKSLPHPGGGGCFVFMCIWVDFWQHGLSCPSLSLFLIHSLLACCCFVSIEAELNASVSGSSGFFIKMHYGTYKECVRVYAYVCVCNCYFANLCAEKIKFVCKCVGCM